MKSKYLTTLAAGLISTLAPAAMSACIYTLTADAPTYNAGTATVKIYLTETLTDGSTSFVNEPGRGGLFGGEIAVQRTSGTDAAMSAVVRNTTQFTDSASYIKDAGNVDWTPAGSPTYVKIANFVDLGASSGVQVSGGHIWLGDVTVALGANPATFSIDMPTNAGGYFATWDAFALDMDPVSQGLPADAFLPIAAGTFQVNPIPEPGMLGLLAVSTLMLIRRR